MLKLPYEWSLHPTLHDSLPAPQLHTPNLVASGAWQVMSGSRTKELSCVREPNFPPKFISPVLEVLPRTVAVPVIAVPVDRVNSARVLLLERALPTG